MGASPSTSSTRYLPKVRGGCLGKCVGRIAGATAAALGNPRDAADREPIGGRGRASDVQRGGSHPSILRSRVCGREAPLALPHALVLVLCGCYRGIGAGPSGDVGVGDDGGTASGSDGDECIGGGDGGTAAGEDGPITDTLAPGRRLRRMTLALLDRFPTTAEQGELESLAEGDREAWFRERAAAMLDDVAFYRRSLAFARATVPIPQADTPAQMTLIIPCAPDSHHPDGWTINADDRDCQDPDTPRRIVEPWWDEGGSIVAVGNAGDERSDIVEADGTPRDCGEYNDSGLLYSEFSACGCGPNLRYCTPEHVTNVKQDPSGQQRLIWEEPSRLFAHIIWHDRPLSDLIAGDYSVGPTRVQAAYVRWGRRIGDDSLDTFDDWWRTSTWSAPVDPEHGATDPFAWSEFAIHTRNTALLPGRDVQFDPTIDAPEQMRGIPSAGMLTSPALWAGYRRERVRAARMLESLACQVFAPPPGDVAFAPYQTDPATQGPCQNCHARIDPAAIHFKRVQVEGQGFHMMGVGADRVPPQWWTGTYPFVADPWPRLVRALQPGTVLTPIGLIDAQANPDSLFIDYLAPDQSLFGATSDGTIGPLGFAKLLLDSGTFDRCMVRRVHSWIVGRDIDPTSEAGYLADLVDTFVGQGRVVRPFIQSLLESETFTRGI